MMSVEVQAPGSREAPSSRTGCSSARGLLCCSLGQSSGSSAPVWPAHAHPGLINAAWTQLPCSTREARQCLTPVWGQEWRGWRLTVQSQTERSPDGRDQRAALISVCIQRASSWHFAVSSPLSVLHPLVEYLTLLNTSAVADVQDPAKRTVGYLS